MTLFCEEVERACMPYFPEARFLVWKSDLPSCETPDTGHKRHRYTLCITQDSQDFIKLTTYLQKPLDPWEIMWFLQVQLLRCHLWWRGLPDCINHIFPWHLFETRTKGLCALDYKRATFECNASHDKWHTVAIQVLGVKTLLKTDSIWGVTLGTTCIISSDSVPQNYLFYWNDDAFFMICWLLKTYVPDYFWWRMPLRMNYILVE